MRKRVAGIATSFEPEHRRFKRGTANMAAPFRGFLTSHNGSSVNFLGDGTIFWGDGTRIQAFSEAAGGFHEQFGWNEAQRGTPRPGGALGSEVVGMETAFVTGRRDRRRP